MDKNLNLDQHISRRYNRELEDLRSEVLRMGGLVERQCRQALEALIRGNSQMAEETAESDQQVNEAEVDIDGRCLEILARRQPAASDLRLVLAVIRLTSNLERVGDEAKKISKLALKMTEEGEPNPFKTEVTHLGESALEMLHGALDAFARLDVEAALTVAGRDPGINGELESLTRVLITHMMEEPQRVKGMLRVNWCARALERIGDHAVNVCEEVIFLVKGSDVRHRKLEETRQRFMPRED